MKNKNISDEEYNICINAWKDNNMKTFKDFLEWYNNLDVLPFIEAVEKMKTFYKNKRLDLFKDGVSLPAIAQEMPTGKHEHIKTYDLKQLKKDILNNDLFGFVQEDIETPEI